MTCRQRINNPSHFTTFLINCHVLDLKNLIILVHNPMP